MTLPALGNKGRLGSFTGLQFPVSESGQHTKEHVLEYHFLSPNTIVCKYLMDCLKSDHKSSYATLCEAFSDFTLLLKYDLSLLQDISRFIVVHIYSYLRS
jgi:hypothetical protein